jgi:DNA-binding HxlR family transcriptional regulator
VITAAAESSKPSLKERLLDTLRRNPDPLNRSELRRRLAVQNKGLGEALSSLEALGRIRRSALGWSA